MTQERPSGAEQPDANENRSGIAESAAEIPLLQETVDTTDVEHEPAPPTSAARLSRDHDHADRASIDSDAIFTLSLQQAVMDDEQHQDIASLEAIVFDSENPNAPASQAKPGRSQATVTAARGDFEVGQVPPVTLTPVPPAADQPRSTKGENPFLPQHILDRLYQGRRNLVEEIAQSGAALDASTAILRTRARSDRLQRSNFGEPAPQKESEPTSMKGWSRKQQLIDELVEEYLPLLAAELRRRLKKVLDE